jgi:hypothetical protein
MLHMQLAGVERTRENESVRALTSVGGEPEASRRLGLQRRVTTGCRGGRCAPLPSASLRDMLSARRQPWNVM